MMRLIGIGTARGWAGAREGSSMKNMVYVTIAAVALVFVYTIWRLA